MTMWIFVNSLKYSITCTATKGQDFYFTCHPERSEGSYFLIFFEK
jgi:hypothetical protein